MASLGNSLTQAYFSAGAASDNPSGSWATGDDPAVGSHYSRLLALNPAIAGHAYNDAQSGSLMAATFGQAGLAVGQGAQYVTIESGTNDVCTATVTAMTSTSDFANSLRATLTQLSTGLPGVRILVASVPNWAGLWANFQTDPAALSAWAVFARCPVLLGANATAAGRAAAAQRISDLNTVIVSVCREFPTCGEDQGAMFSLWSSLTVADLAPDFFHLSLAGQARLAEATWRASPYSHRRRG